jgi:uncharacterized protein (DUF1800 family)
MVVFSAAAVEGDVSSDPPVMRPDQKVIHLLNRITLGPRPGDVDRVKQIGIDAFIRSQLHPESITESHVVTETLGTLETLKMTPQELFQKYWQGFGMPKRQDPEAAKARSREMAVVHRQASQARLVRALYSERQLSEIMVEFWFNHFNVFAGKGLDRIWIGIYEEQAIRPKVFGRFRDLLGATARHPAMLFYLDNWLNTAPNSAGAKGQFQGLNENYARELLELHTLGVDGGYGQKDVISLARILTGWGIVPRNPRTTVRPGRRWGISALVAPLDWTTRGFFFDDRRHDFSDKVFLGHHIKGQGKAEVEQVLDILARHPATARHICFKLAQYFVADDPPKTLVDKMTHRYHETDGDIREVLDVLFHSSEFWEPGYYAAKYKSPFRYVISAVRATGIAVRNYAPLNRFMRGLGMPLYGCGTPDGYKNTRDAWLNPDGTTKRLNFATVLAAGRLPLERQPQPDDSAARASFQAPGQGELKRWSGQPDPVDPALLRRTLNGLLSDKTEQVLTKTPWQLQGAFILGSPEFMMY